MNDLIEKVAKLICETENVDGFKCTCPIPFEPDWCHGNRAKAQARAAIAAVAEWLEAIDFSDADLASEVAKHYLRAELRTAGDGR